MAPGDAAEDMTASDLAAKDLEPDAGALPKQRRNQSRLSTP
jgi:hypothetical protein